MLKSLLRDRWLLLFLFLTLFIRLFSLFPTAVERTYTYGFYTYYSRFLRLLLGWLPFSLGDLLYLAAGIFLAFKVVKIVRLLLKKQLRAHLRWPLLWRWMRYLLAVYLLFNLSWGLNYDRQGIAAQLGLQVGTYTKAELFDLTRLLQQRLNTYSVTQDSIRRLLQLRNNRFLFEEGVRCYDTAAGTYPFLTYRHPSIKPSLYSHVGHYFGFSGYINPFTGEAQINTEEPVYTLPFVVNHEMAHQVGYGKENEANFVSYLICKSSPNDDFRYSAYYELYFDAYYECRRTGDTAAVRALTTTLYTRVLRDRIDEIEFRLKRRNRLEPLVSDVYGNYLKMNGQPHGLRTYNEVIGWLIAYVKKFGAERL